MAEIQSWLFAGAWDAALWEMAAFTLAVTHITIASVTIFLHRCMAHRSVDLSPVMSHFFRLWLWLNTGMVTREWTAVHRKHHAKAETEEDPHSPQIHGIASVLFAGVVHYVREKKNPETIARYGAGTPDDWLERNLYSRMNFLGILIVLAANIALFGVVPGFLLWLVQMAWIPFWAAGVINGVGHYWGYRNFQPQDESRNIVPLAFVIGGEELHNNHHAFPTSAKFSNRWYEFDIGWVYIRLMQAAGLAKVKRVAPTMLSGDARSACDLDTLQSVITNRMEVASRFAKVLHKTCHDELRELRRAGCATALRSKALTDWLRGMESRLSAADKISLRELRDQSGVIGKIGAMRAELISLWEDKSATADQLVERLSQWCAKAEKSGIGALADFARDLRGCRVSYAAH